MLTIFLVLLLIHGSFQGYSCFSSNAVVTGSTEGLQRILEESSVCPFDMARFRQTVSKYATGFGFMQVQSECRALLQSFRIVRADYIRRTGDFTFSAYASSSCWDEYDSIVNDYVKSFSVRDICGVQDQWISDSCLNISTKSEFEALIPKSQLQEITNLCNQSLDNSNSTCAPCIASLTRIQSAYFEVPAAANVSDCEGFPVMYAAAFANQLGPFDLATIQCFFSIFNTSDPRISDMKHKAVHRWLIIGSVLSVLLAIVMIWVLWRLAKQCGTRTVDVENAAVVAKGVSGFEMLGEGITLLRFGIDELKLATGNFSMENLIGRGGYGNVFKGVLKDGSEVAVKRFKNCSISGDEVFGHEVQVIASVRHVNLVALRGYCTGTTYLEGHQRIIVCDYIRNGSLHDHLFSPNAQRLSWPIRRKIAIGIARGLAYLHDGVQPPIIHRDVKASNIMLDEAFEPKLADFGLAKFTPDGISHVSTKVAGTLGYVCPEYALYGRLTEKSDVYSFGVVLLELLSGKKAVVSFRNGQAELLTDVAWSLVRQGRALDIIEENLHEMNNSKVMEKHVLAAIISVHPVSEARPTMKQIVNILESETDLVSLSSIPEFASAATEIVDSHPATITKSSSIDEQQSASQEK